MRMGTGAWSARQAGGGAGFDRDGGRLRGAIRLVAATGLSLGGLFLTGCNCQERMCDTVKTVAVELVLWSDNCCNDPNMKGCDDLNTKFSELMRLVREARVACQNDNDRRLKEIWEEIKRLKLPENILDIIRRRLGLPTEVRNSSMLLHDRDAVSINFASTQTGNTTSLTTIVAMDGTRYLPEAFGKAAASGQVGPNGVVVSQVLSPGDPGAFKSYEYSIPSNASIVVASRFGTYDFSVSGTLSITDFSPAADGGQMGVPSNVNLTLTAPLAKGTIKVDLTSPDNYVYVGADGHGRIGFASSFYFLNALGMDTNGLFDTVWVEMPFVYTNNGSTLDFAAVGASQGGDILPYNRETVARVEAYRGEAVAGDVAGESDCDFVDGPDGNRWRRRSKRWLDMMHSEFRECYPVVAHD